ncbi:MAG: ribosome maturation factor RimM [Campylobacterota bacterium]|nr:ribosome maturation factor RimM [Campylobacterota bacterium]
MSESIYVAKLGKTVGLKGQLKLHIDSDFPQQFKVGATFITNKKRNLTIEHYNAKSHTVKFTGINTIDDARKLVTQQLFVSQEQTRSNCTLEDKQFFWFDLIGCSIVENGQILGTIKEIHRYPIDDYLEINTSVKLLEQEHAKTFLIPYNDTFVSQVNLDMQTVTSMGAYDILLNS